MIWDAVRPEWLAWLVVPVLAAGIMAVAVALRTRWIVPRWRGRVAWSGALLVLSGLLAQRVPAVLAVGPAGLVPDWAVLGAASVWGNHGGSKSWPVEELLRRLGARELNEAVWPAAAALLTRRVVEVPDRWPEGEPVPLVPVGPQPAGDAGPWLVVSPIDVRAYCVVPGLLDPDRSYERFWVDPATWTAAPTPDSRGRAWVRLQGTLRLPGEGKPYPFDASLPIDLVPADRWAPRTPIGPWLTDRLQARLSRQITSGVLGVRVVLAPGDAAGAAIERSHPDGWAIRIALIRDGREVALARYRGPWPTAMAPAGPGDPLLLAGQPEALAAVGELSADDPRELARWRVRVTGDLAGSALLGAGAVILSGEHGIAIEEFLGLPAPPARPPPDPVPTAPARP